MLFVLLMFIVLSFLVRYVAATSNQINPSITIQRGSALQDYLCSGHLKSNVTIALDDGEHRLSSEPLCSISNEGSIKFTGSSTKRTIIRCDVKGRAFAFVSVQTLTMERIIFINCGLELASVENTYILNCTFQNRSNGAISSKSSKNTYIASSVFANTLGGAVMFYRSTGTVIITYCAFQNNSARSVMLDGSAGNVYAPSCTIRGKSSIHGGAVMLYGSSGNVSITHSTFHNNEAYYGGAVMFHGSAGNVNITSCTFQNNSAIHGGAVMLYGSISNVCITNCTFQYNSAALGNGSGVILSGSTGDIGVTSCTFENNSGSVGGAVMLSELAGNVRITRCRFRNNRAFIGGAMMLHRSTGNVSITNSAFLNNSADYGGALTLDALAGTVTATTCTFQNNSAGGGGSAVMVHGSTGFTSITYCTFQSSSAAHGGSVLFHRSAGNITATSCTFQNNNAEYGGAVMLYESTSSVRITYCAFENNSAYYGGAVSLHQSTGDVTIASCTFQNSSAASIGGALMLYGSANNVAITNCKFQNNGANYSGAVRLSSTGSVTIRGCTFQNNNALIGGAMILSESAGSIHIINCIFQNNSAHCDGGAVLLLNSTNNVSIINTTFDMNSAYLGGAIYITPKGFNLFIFMTSFTNNTAAAGAAVYSSYDDYNSIDFITIQAEINQLALQDVIVKDNHCSFDTCTGAIYFKGVKMDISGNTDTGSHFVSNSPQGAIQGEDGFLSLYGYITFANNTGVNGGAISLYNVPLYFNANCTVEFSHNLATGYGGAIYSNGKQFNPTQGFYYHTNEKYNCILRFFIPAVQQDLFEYCNGSFSITFIYNHAQKGGHAVYATPIYNCIFSRILAVSPQEYNCDRGLMDYFTVTPLPEDSNDGQVLSFPEHVNYCGCSDPNLCNGTSQYLTTYPGRTVRLNVTSVDHNNNLSPSVVYTQVDTNGPQNITLGPQQSNQWIGTVCGIIEYQIYGPEKASFKLLLSNHPSASPTIIHVKLLPCEPGFTLMPDVSTSGLKCDCSQFFTSLGVACDISDGTVTRSKTNWIGVYNNTDPALAETCPKDYCNAAIRNLSPARPGYLCNGGRTGIICGHCHGNLSVIFGSSKYQECSDMWLTTLVMFAVSGVILVAALFFLNLTITQGTLYGLIFYANIIQVNTSIFFNQSTLNPLQVIVSFVNLDLGLPMCFYNGMDDADKAGLQFVFPAYLLILTMATILTCHYCLQRSSITSSTSFLGILSTIIGERAVGVLSTLIYLSYSKLLRTVIDILTYSTIHLPSGDMYVWFYDGNVQYLRGKHTVLFVVAITTCTLFLLPYTIALTFIPIIEQNSEHNRLFKYLHKTANQIKPMNDAHYAPYKGEWRWWLGARLWLLVVMYTLNPVYSSDKPSLLLTIQATMVILFTISQASIQPFGEFHQLRHKLNRHTNFYNRLYNSLDMFYLLNYTALAMSMSYILGHSSDQTQITSVAVGVLVGLFVVMLMATVLYHLIVAILRVFKMYDRTREKFNGLFNKKKKESNAATELDQPINDTVSTTTVTVNYDLREPLSED